jgi:hypothetical protein
MAWRDAFTNLSTIAVSGVATSYDLDGLPNALPAEALPALAPAFPQHRERREGMEGLAVLTFDGARWTATMHVEHVLYWLPAWSEAGLAAVLPALVEAIDDYLAAVSADGTLDSALDEELVILEVAPGVVTYAGTRYYGVRFLHRWRRYL